MDNEKLAHFILELRKSHHMTQKELAEKLNVTDKAVSKWERGLSCPDISLLSSLSEILGVTVSELLNGEKSETVTNDVEMVVETTLQYADKVTRKKSKDIRTASIIAVSAVLGISIFVCIICDMAISHGITWSWYPISACIYGWLLIVPTIKRRKKRVVTFLALLSILTIPYLFALSMIIGNNLIMPIGIRSFIISIVYLWLVFFLFCKWKRNNFFSAGVALLLLIPVELLVNFSISKWTNDPLVDIWSVMSYGIIAVLAFILFAIGYRKN